ncbi:MAG: hypothetical protein HY077_15260 [Elusimicrobia bacterium]|nr:hypothetical protein [Elusimicrobiota bacterium]
MRMREAAVEDRKRALGSFSALLRQYRRGLGHPSARAFFEAQGGRTFFGCTYRAYLNLENGLSVPQPALVEKLAAAFWIAVDEPKAREFTLAYLRVLLGAGRFTDYAVESLSRQDDAPGREQAARPGAEGRETVLSAAQAQILYRSAQDYWCFTLLANDAGRWTPDGLAKVLGLPVGRVSKSLTALQRARLLSRDGEGRWFCPHRGTLLFHPKDQPYRPQDLAALRRHWERMARRRGGELISEHPVLTRCSESELRGYFPYLMNSLLAADHYTRTQAGPDTAFFLIELVVQKLLPL